MQCDTPFFADTNVSTESDPVISFRQLTRYYGRRVGVDSLDLDITEGEIFGFLGPNGAGKTTAIRLLLGFLRPTAGSARVFGRDCWKQGAAVKRHVGYLPGDLRLYPWMTGRNALKTSGRIRGIDLNAMGRDLSERFQVDMELPARKMSRGTRQKIGLLLALAHQPELLILDEPTSGLDPLMQGRLCEYLRELAGRGHTVFFSSHTLSEVEQLCDRVAIIRDGKIVTDQRLEVLRSRACRSVTVLFADDQTAGLATPPETLRVLSQIGRQWQAELAGPVQDLIQWAAGQSLDDLQIGPPSLDGLFRQFYQSANEPSGNNLPGFLGPPVVPFMKGGHIAESGFRTVPKEDG